jgi:hypothetical protein
MTTDWAALSDGELWSRAARKRDGEAFGQLFERHANAVYAHCFRRTGSWSAADGTAGVFPGTSSVCAALGLPNAAS